MLYYINSKIRRYENKIQKKMDLTLLVAGAFFYGVALSAFGSKDFISGFGITGWCLFKRRHWLISPQRKRKLGLGFGLGETKEKEKESIYNRNGVASALENGTRSPRCMHLC